MKTIVNWRLFFILWIASSLSILAVLPYSLSLQTNTLQNLNLPVSLPALIVLQVIQNAILFGILILAGLFFAGRVGLGLPILESALHGETVTHKVRAILPISLILGVSSTLIVLGLEFLYFQPAMIKELGDPAAALNLQSQPAAWKGLLASFYGGLQKKFYYACS